jgi:hypothetical protein
MSAPSRHDLICTENSNCKISAGLGKRVGEDLAEGEDQSICNKYDQEKFITRINNSCLLILKKGSGSIVLKKEIVIIAIENLCSRTEVTKLWRKVHSSFF